MSDSAGERQKVRINLTPEQARQLKAATGRDLDAIELTAQELEQRIVPNLIASGTAIASPDALAANSNEVLLTARQ